MKRLFIALIAISGLAFTANAQEFGFAKGNVIVEGNIGFNSENDKNAEEKSSSFGINPKAGYFVTDKIAVGLSLGFNTTKEEDYAAGSESVDKTNSFDIGVFGRYYFLELGKRFKTYAEVGLGYGTSRDETEVGGTTTKGPKVNTLGINAGIGANYFLTEKIALNVGLANIINFESQKVDVSGAKASTNFGLAAGTVNNIFDVATLGLTFKF